MLRHKITVLICIIFIAALSFLAYEAYNTDQGHLYVEQAEQSVKAEANKKAQDFLIQQEKARLKTECDKETAYYHNLTIKQQATVVAPNCNLQMVQ